MKIQSINFQTYNQGYTRIKSQNNHSNKVNFGNNPFAELEGVLPERSFRKLGLVVVDAVRKVLDSTGLFSKVDLSDGEYMLRSDRFCRLTEVNAPIIYAPPGVDVQRGMTCYASESFSLMGGNVLGTVMCDGHTIVKGSVLGEVDGHFVLIEGEVIPGGKVVSDYYISIGDHVQGIVDSKQTAVVSGDVLEGGFVKGNIVNVWANVDGGHIVALERVIVGDVLNGGDVSAKAYAQARNITDGFVDANLVTARNIGEGGEVYAGEYARVWDVARGARVEARTVEILGQRHSQAKIIADKLVHNPKPRDRRTI
ncbi:MAG: hypothetical protein PHC64_02695 [Candidatus Gastranaerophilales bacterium]|nr:hypothetical protein [Candidatus Gastranaerophilales bacterium]